MRVLLVTHNISGVFDDVSALSSWVDSLRRLVANRDADFVAVHLQEVGGSSWRTNGLHAVEPLAAALRWVVLAGGQARSFAPSALPGN